MRSVTAWAAVILTLLVFVLLLGLMSSKNAQSSVAGLRTRALLLVGLADINEQTCAGISSLGSINKDRRCHMSSIRKYFLFSYFE